MDCRTTRNVAGRYSIQAAGQPSLPRGLSQQNNTHRQRPTTTDHRRLICAPGRSTSGRRSKPRLVCQSGNVNSTTRAIIRVDSRHRFACLHLQAGRPPACLPDSSRGPPVSILAAQRCSPSARSGRPGGLHCSGHCSLAPGECFSSISLVAPFFVDSARLQRLQIKAFKAVVAAWVARQGEGGQPSGGGGGGRRQACPSSRGRSKGPT